MEVRPIFVLNNFVVVALFIFYYYYQYYYVCSVQCALFLHYTLMHKHVGLTLESRMWQVCAYIEWCYKMQRCSNLMLIHEPLNKHHCTHSYTLYIKHQYNDKIRCFSIFVPNTIYHSIGFLSYLNGAK